VLVETPEAFTRRTRTFLYETARVYMKAWNGTVQKMFQETLLLFG